MSLLKRKPTMDTLYEEAEYLEVENKVYELRVESLVRRKTIKQLEKEYGKGWQRLLGLSNKSSLESLKSFLTKFKTKSKGLHTADTSKMSPLPCYKPSPPMGPQSRLK